MAEGQAVEVIPVGLGGSAGVSHIVDDHAVDLGKGRSWPGPLIFHQVVHRHVVRQPYPLAGEAPALPAKEHRHIGKKKYKGDDK